MPSPKTVNPFRLSDNEQNTEEDTNRRD
jgi:hypothetical protein